MNCDDVRELAGAFVLRALDPAEMRAVQEHLEGCPEQHEEVTQLRATARVLAATAAERDPPAGARSRLLERLAAERGEPAALRPETRAPTPRGTAPWVPWAVAAVMAVVAVAFAAWALVLASGDDGSEAIVRQISGGTIEGRLTYIADDSTASLTLGGLEPLGAERSYQLWVIHDGEPSSLGVFNAASDGTAGATFQAELEHGDVVAVTIEPFGGSPAPTSDAILSTEI